MADFKSIKDSLIGTLGTVAEKTKDFADKAVDKAKDVSRIARLNIELNSEKANMEKTYAEIGKLYYETRKDNPDGFFVQLCDDIGLAKENIERIQDEIAYLKASSPDCCESCVEVEFEEVVCEEKADCSCGCAEHSEKPETAETEEKKDCSCGCSEHSEEKAE